MESREELIKGMKHLVGEQQLEVIGIDDSFGFKCQQCGRCCMNREDIILNPFDIYNGAKYLGISTEEFIKNYTHIDLGAHSKIPMVLLRTSDNGFCPLLKFDIKDGGKFKCMIHPAKPGACANHPIGVAYSFKKENGETAMTDVQYVKVEQCENSVSDEMHTVREWIQPYLDNSDEIAVAHEIQHLVTNYFNPRSFYILSMLFRSISDVAPEGVEEETKDNFKEMCAQMLAKYIEISISLGYASYDIEKPFIEQAQLNIKYLDDFYVKTKEMMDASLELIREIVDKLQDDEVKENLQKALDEIMEV